MIFGIIQWPTKIMEIAFLINGLNIWTLKIYSNFKFQILNHTRTCIEATHKISEFLELSWISYKFPKFQHYSQIQKIKIITVLLPHSHWQADPTRQWLKPVTTTLPSLIGRKMRRRWLSGKTDLTKMIYYFPRTNLSYQKGKRCPGDTSTLGMADWERRCTA